MSFDDLFFLFLEVVEDDGAIGKEPLYVANGIHIRMEVFVIRGGHKDKVIGIVWSQFDGDP